MKIEGTCNETMKKLKFVRIMLVAISFVCITTLLSVENTYASVDPKAFKLIDVIEKDTTGKGVKDTINILADEENQGYLVEIKQHNGKKYTLKSSSKNYNYLAPYAPFMKLNIVIEDINNDNVPEIITWGSMTHENDINIFQWNGSEYKNIFYGFYTNFYFKDITGDKIPELVIDNRLYGTGYEYIYFQWQKDKYEKIYYDLDATRGFDKIKYLFSILSNLSYNDYILDHPEYLKDTFTDEWISNKNNINYLKELKSQIFSIQFLEYLDEKLIWSETDRDFPIEDNWRFKVLNFKINGTKIIPEEKVMEVQTKLTDRNKREYKISDFIIK